MRILIIGSGVAAHSAAEAIRSYKFDAEIVMFSKEAEPEYSACVLPYYVSGEVSRERNYLKSLADYSRIKIDLRLNHEVESIDPVSQTIGVQGRQEPYDQLILAVGTEPIIPKLPGTQLPGNYTFKTMADADVLAAREINRAIVVGSGAVGVEAALALQRRGAAVCLVEKLPVILPRMLRGKPAEFAAKALEDQGVEVRCATEVKAVIGQNKVEAVNLDGEIVHCDTIIWGVGMHPATSGLADDGIKLDERGFIVTDSRMRTNLPNVFACGDCASTYGLHGTGPQNIMLWHIAKAGGRTAGLNALGNDVPIKPLRAQTVVNIGTQVFAGVGELPGNVEDFLEYQFGNKTYRLNFRDGLLVQGQSVNDLATLGVLQAFLGKSRQELSDGELYRKMPWLLRGRI